MMEQVKEGSPIAELLSWCEAQKASDLHAQAEKPFRVRINGELRVVPLDEFVIPSAGLLDQFLRESFSTACNERIESGKEVDLSFYHGTVRYRANFSRQLGRRSFSFRTVPQHRMRLKDLQLPVSLKGLLEQPRGLVVITGPTGQGKSTTARALVQEINESRAARIITIEDPIEYVFDDVLSQFEQREVGIDTDSFANGIRNAMRQDPNVLFIGEIRDRDSIWAALQAAETGHLVVTTLHADSVAQAISRLREFYPSSEQGNVSSLLARNVHSMICQRLLPNTSGTRTPCLEVMKRDAGVADAILNNNLVLLSGIIESAVGQGMHTHDQYLVELLASGVITEATARHFAFNRHRLELLLRGIVTSRPILAPEG